MLRCVDADDVLLVQLDATAATWILCRYVSHRLSFRFPSLTNHMADLTQTLVSIATVRMSPSEAMQRLKPIEV
ncbi:hypothetical protein E2C01_023295 [Portunus trituberculatus]|uniref:Uncharacterized protein n=1 Tax=Portunus trituberculatus TaxID=210409 RepID=A0A5B7E7M5_PORTR|nr:hypothetical protein [Portunus trituberculatus]